MSHVLLVEPADDFCLFLRLAISSAGCRMTIAGSIAEAWEVLHGADTVDIVISNAALPDGSGLGLARDAAQGKPAFILRATRERIAVSDRDGVVFRGSRIAVCDFLKEMILRRLNGKAIDTTVKVGGE